jgi:glycosyltransferase involved in cell wall biosynthesis
MSIQKEKNLSNGQLVHEESAQTQSTLAIIPAYNEENSIADIVEKTKAYVDKVIVIDDASTDDTKAIASEVADGVVSHPKNMGVGGAVHTGYLVAIEEGFDVVIQIDGDGQHDPSYIPEMLEKIDEDDADMVIGSRWLNESYQDYSLIRRAGIRFFTFEANTLGGLDITDVTSGFRAYRTSMLTELGRPENSHWALEQTIEAAKSGFNIEEVSVPMPPATEGSQFDLETFLKYPPRMVFITLKVLLFR